MQLAAAAQDDRHQVRALADVISSGNAGVLPPAWSSEVRNYIDSQRYLFAAVGSMAFPSSGHSLTIPKLTQSTLVGPRGAEKSEIPSRALTTGSDVFTAAWYAGGVDVSLEVIWQSDPSVWSLVVENILQQYAVVTDQALNVAQETIAVDSGAPLDFTDWGTLAKQIIATAEVSRGICGAQADLLSLTSASWQELIGLMDNDGRRLFAPVGATNSDGSASLLARSINIGGVSAFHNPRAAVDTQFSAHAARVAEKAPTTLVSDNVALMGRDLGVLGAFIYIPAYAAAIFKHVTPAAAAAKK